MPSFYRLQGTVQNPLGQAIPGASVAVLTQPASFSTQPGSPLASIYAADTSNAATITGASWSGQQITFTLSATPPTDIVVGSFIGVSGASPAGYNSTAEEPWLVAEVQGNNVIVAALTNPGTYVSGGTVATSVLPNPVPTDGNGQWFAYTAPGLYSVQVYGSTITEQDYPDQQNGTVAGGSVLSVGMIGDDVIYASSITGSPVTTTGSFDLSGSLKTQSANSFLAGPTSGGAAAPTFRALTSADLPAGLGSVSSVALTLTVPSAVFTSSISGSPVTSSGTLGATLGLQPQSANQVWAGPTSGSSGTPTFRALVVADIPASGYASLSASILIGGQQDAVQTASGTTDAITFPGSAFVTTAGIDAMTLATPASPADNGKIVRIFDTSGHAHTVTAASNVIAPSHHLLTFNGTVGSNVELEAFGGIWYIVGTPAGVTPS